MLDKPRTDDAIVEFRGVVKRYPAGTVALRSVDLVFRRGQSVAIVGKSGSGKSTLLNLLGLLDHPSEGSILLNGTRADTLSDAGRSSLRAVQLGFIFQRAHLMSDLTVRDNVEMGSRYAGATGAFSHQIAEQSISSVGLLHRIDALAKTLSGGEMQRAAIARTLARPEAQLWLADEPTGNLDTKQSLEIIELLRMRAAEHGAALIVVTHEPEIAERLDRIIRLVDGVVVEDTTVVANPSTAGLAVDTDRPRPVEFSKLPTWLRTLQFVLRSLSAYRRRAWTGVAAAAIATAMVVVALGLAQSAASQVSGLFDAQRATEVTAHFAVDKQPQRWPIDSRSASMYPGVVDLEYWRYVEGVPVTNGSLVTVDSTLAISDSAPGDATESKISWAKPRSASRILKVQEVILGKIVADRLGISQVDLLPSIVVNGQQLTVVGIVTESRIASATGLVFIAPGTLDFLDAQSLTSDIFVQTTPGAAGMVAKRLPALTDPFASSRIEIDPVLAPDAYQDQLEGNVATSLKVLAAVASLAGLAAVVFVNVLSVSSRTAEFGVRRAFGARRSELLGLVVGESVFLSIIGSCLGLLLGFTTIMIITIIARWQPVFDPQLLLVPIVAGLAFGVVGGVPPAVAAGRIQPADAVRSS